MKLKEGTTNTYIIYDVFDFINIGSGEITDIVTKEYFFELNNDIDFNDHPDYKFGINTASLINASKSTIIGNGHKIRNMTFGTNDKISSTITVFKFKSIKNVIFENMVCAIKKYNNDTSGGSPCLFYLNDRFYDCSFSIYTHCSQPFFLFNNTGTNSLNSDGYGTSFVNCSFNLYGGTNINFEGYNQGLSMFFRILYFNRCHINFSNLVINGFTRTDASSSKYAIFYSFGSKFEYTYLTGNIILGNSRSGLCSYLYLPFFDYNHTTKVKSTYIAVSLEDFYGTDDNRRSTFESTFNNAPYFSDDHIKFLDSCFMDKELLFKEVTDKENCYCYNHLTKQFGGSSSNFYFLTTEECKNNKELVKLNFPVVELNNEE